MGMGYQRNTKIKSSCDGGITSLCKFLAQALRRVGARYAAPTRFTRSMLERAVAFLLLSGASSTPMLAVGAETVTVRLDWLASGYHAPLLVAKERGLYAAQGLDVHF